MLERGFADAKRWTTQTPGELDERPPHLLFHGATAPRYGDGRPATLVELGVTVETVGTFADGSAPRRLKGLREWRARKPGRWVVLFAPRDLDPAKYQGLGADQVVDWPLPLNWTGTPITG